MIYVDPYHVAMAVYVMACIAVLFDRCRARREIFADIAQCEADVARHLSALDSLACELHHVEDVVSCGVVVARLCVDCDKQIDAPEWLAHA